MLECMKEYGKQNRPRLSAVERIRYHSDPVFRLRKNLRNRIRQAMKVGLAGSAVKDLGCSVEELKQYLESKFQPGMHWKNYGRRGWHIDHIIPLVRFDLSDRDQFLKAAHYTNLQPMWAKDNRTKWKS